MNIDVETFISLKYIFLDLALIKFNCVSECEDGWKEHGGKCYFFSDEKWSWVGAEEECKRNHGNGSHLASVTDQQTDDFLARTLKEGSIFWIGAKKTNVSNNGSWNMIWTWSDGSQWTHTSWGKVDRAIGDTNEEGGCAFFSKDIGNKTWWSASECDSRSSKKQFKYVCNKSICSKDTKLDGRPSTHTKGPITIAVVTSVAIFLISVTAVLTYKYKLSKKRKEEEKNVRSDENPLYGQYYKVFFIIIGKSHEITTRWTGRGLTRGKFMLRIGMRTIDFDLCVCNDGPLPIPNG